MKDLKNGAQFVLETKEELNDLIMKFLDSPEEAGEFASLIASEKLMSFGPYKSLI